MDWTLTAVPLTPVTRLISRYLMARGVFQLRKTYGRRVLTAACEQMCAVHTAVGTLCAA